MKRSRQGGTQAEQGGGVYSLPPSSGLPSEEADTIVDLDEPTQKPIKQLVVFWKAGYGAGLDCVTSANRENSIPELAKILCDNLYWDSSIASKVADVIFGPKPKSNLVHWKKDVTRALEEALILTSKESKQNFYGNLPY